MRFVALNLWQRAWLGLALVGLAGVAGLAAYLALNEYDFYYGLAVMSGLWLAFAALLYAIGQCVAWIRTGRGLALAGIGAAACAWFAAWSIEIATRLMYAMYHQLGADLPGPSLLTVAAVQSYVPWLFAAASTALLVYAWMRSRTWYLAASVAIACITTASVSFVAISLVLPTVKCGFSWPEWPQAERKDPPGGACGRR